MIYVIFIDKYFYLNLNCGFVVYTYVHMSMHVCMSVSNNGKLV